MASPNSRSQLLRRDFLVGGIAGLSAATAGAIAAPPEWKQKALPDGTKLSYAQTGEDLFIQTLLERLGIEKPTYLDIGAFLPILGSNTYLLYRQGGHGVLVEPNVALIPELRSKRPRDTVLNVGIGFDGQDSEADYYVLNHPQMNTFDADEAKRRVADSAGVTRIEKVVKMPLVNVNRVMAEHFGGSAPDFVSTDTEGLDLLILKTFDFKNFRPKVICAETMGDQGLRMLPEVTELMTANGYVVRGMTVANTFYIDGKLLG